MKNDDQKQFNDELASFYNAITRNSKLLAGQYINTNTGVQSKMFFYLIGSNGLDNRNAKGKDLLFLLKSIKF